MIKKYKIPANDVTKKATTSSVIKNAFILAVVPSICLNEIGQERAIIFPFL